MRPATIPRRAASAALPALCTGLAYALGAMGLGAESVWFDEAWSAYAAGRPTLLASALADPTNPPLYYLLLHGAVRALGDDPWPLRWLSLALAVLVVPLAYQLGGRLDGRRAGRIAAFLAACSPLLVWAGREARMYSLLAVLTLLAAIAWHRLRGPLDPRRLPAAGPWLLLGTAELALLYAHNTGPVAALWLNAVTLLAWLGDRRARRPARPGPAPWLAGQALIFLLWAPYLVLRFAGLPAANQSVAASSRLEPAFLARLWQAPWTGTWERVGEVPVAVALAALALGIFLAARPWRRPGGRWCLVHLGLLLAGLLAGLRILQNELHGRYLVMMLPFLLVAYGIGLARLARPWGMAAALLLGLGGLGTTWLVLAGPAGGHPEVRAMVRHYAEQLDAEASVVAWSYADRYDLAYYWRRLGVRARRLTLPEGADLAAIAPLLPVAGDVAIDQWHAQRADFRGMLECLLAQGTRRAPELHSVPGSSTRIYRERRLQLPRLRPVAGDFGVLRLSAAGSPPRSTAERAACVPVEVVVAEPHAEDLQVALILRDAAGLVLAQADAPLATADQRGSARAEPGESLAAFPLLRLPPGTPPGRYPLYLRLYDAARLDGLPLAGGPAGAREVALGAWEVLPGAVWTGSGHPLDLPRRVDAPVSENLVLVAHDAPEAPAPVAPGQAIAITLLWRGSGPLPDLSLGAEDGRWSLAVPAPQGVQRDDLLRDRRMLRLPREAGPGPAVLRIEAGPELARYEPAGSPFLAEPPALDLRGEWAFPGFGTLVGLQAPLRSLGRDEELPVTLVWRGGERAAAAERQVSVQLLDAAGRLIAQHDGPAAGGTRPAPGWRAGEHIVDPHALRFRPEAGPGPATLAVAVYDPRSGRRERTAEGKDLVRLPLTIEVR